jgi:dCTP deaminase
MLLSDREIRLVLKSGDLGITPEPPTGHIQPASIDLRIGPKIRRFKDDVNVSATTLNIEILDVSAYIRDNTKETDISHENFIFKPGEFAIGETLEIVRLSNVLSGRIEGRSSLARMGIGVHVTAPKIDPGFNNHITLEMFHIGRRQVQIPSGMVVCTLLIERLGFPSGGLYSGSFQG